MSRLGSRIALVHASLVAAFAIVGATVFLFAAQRALDSEMAMRSRAVARMTARGIDPSWIAPLVAGSVPVRTLAQHAILVGTSAGGAARVAVLDAHGTVLASSDERAIPAGQTYPILAVDGADALVRAAVEPSGISGAPYRGENGSWYQSAYASLGDGAALVAVEMEVVYRTPLERLRRAVTVFALAGVAAAAAIGLLLARGITRPLARLATSMESVAADGLPPPAGVTGTDEVGALGRRFDELLEALRRHDAELRALSGTVAHEVRNPLGAMSGFAELLARAHPDAETKRLTDGIREEVAALERLVSRFLAFAGDVRVRRKPIDVGELVEDSLRAAIPPGAAVHLHRSLPPAGTSLQGDPDLLREVLVNLLRNGAQATAFAGNLAIQVTDLADRVELRVKDDGPGIAKEIRDRMFQPFATTKADGTGLGLAICRRIVTGHGGTLSFESDASGTTFVVVLPKGTTSWPGS